MHILFSRRRLLLAGGGITLLDTRAAAAGGLTDGQWHDTARQRTLPWRLRLPAADGPWPLVLYSHGLGGSREGGQAWGEAWADAGMAVLHLQHPGSDSDTLRGGAQQLRAAASAEQLLARVADMRFALDELTRRKAAGQSPWQGVNLDAIGVAGHSFGARTTQVLAGERFAIGASLADPRPRAFIALSPSSPAGASGSASSAFADITRPFMGITGSLDGDPFGSFSGGERRAAVYDGLPPGQRALLWLDGADHMTFGGGRAAGVGQRGLFRRAGGAQDKQPVHQAAVARISTLWWQAQLIGSVDARQSLKQGQGQGQVQLGPGDRLTLG